ncbi:hypothetical protein [Acetobacter thailandicus]|uniref:hypothetical protein n=1 Tax=Acetobacter thailandicus TaxID=1502842 RepID=UPI001FCFC745|nr:hypothetical protein [Acetobacter thailandicus]
MTSASGTPITSLPLASSVALTDTLLGVVTSGGETTAQQVSVGILGSAIASDAATAAGNNAAATVSAMRGVAGGVAALDSAGHLALSDGAKLVSVLTVTSATQSTPAILSPDIPLSDQTQIGTGGTILADIITRADALPSGTYYVDQNDIVRRARTVGTLPDDVTVNGGVYIAGSSTLPAGLTSEGDVIITDGTVYFPNTWNNNGVLCAAGV